MKLGLSSVIFAIIFCLCSAVPSALAGNGPVLIVASGGFNSCGQSSEVSGLSPYGMSMHGHVQALIRETQRHIGERSLRYLVNCHETAPPPSGMGNYYTHEDTKKIKRGNARDLISEIERLAPEKETEIYIIGHSYGGWVAMYLAQELKSIYNLEGLFSIDAISPKGCGPLQVIIGAPGCHRAPVDLKNDAIAARSTTWLNFYQNQDKWLNSSAIPQATNFHIKYRGPHTSIDVDNRVWGRIHENILAR